MHCIYYTGGTTGVPKGVMLSHDNLMISALGSLATGNVLTPRGRLLHAAPMFHLAGLASWVSGQLVGSTHVFVPMFTSSGVLEAVARHQVTDLMLVPTMIQMLVDHPGVGDYDLSSVRRLFYAATPISEAVLRRAVKTFPGAGFTQGYGMTELSPTATLLGPEDHEVEALRRSAGRAAPHAEVRIADENDLEVPLGTVGEVVVRGDHVMLGYWNRPDETATALRGGWMHTGGRRVRVARVLPRAHRVQGAAQRGVRRRAADVRRGQSSNRSCARPTGSARASRSTERGSGEGSPELRRAQQRSAGVRDRDQHDPTGPVQL